MGRKHKLSKNIEYNDFEKFDSEEERYYKELEEIENKDMKNTIDNDIIFEIYNNIKKYTENKGIPLCENLSYNDIYNFITKLK